MTADAKKNTLQKLFWDYNFTGEELQSLLEGTISRVGHLDTCGLYVRMLSSLTWYDVLNLVGREHLEDLLSDAVVNRIFSKDLRRKYGVARRILYR
jgi:hypothetical protein